MPILGKASPEDMNLHPMRYQWAYDLYNQAVRNTWFPHEIALKEDLEDWNKMTEDERHAVKFTMAFFNPAELIVNRVLALGVYPYLKSPECHLYLAKQMWEEANHCVAFEYVLETFPFDREKIFNVHLETPSMQAKENYVMKYLKRMTEDKLDIETPEGKKDFIRNLVATNLVMEGIWFYSGFMVVLSFRQRNQLRERCGRFPGRSRHGALLRAVHRPRHGAHACDIQRQRQQVVGVQFRCARPAHPALSERCERRQRSPQRPD